MVMFKRRMGKSVSMWSPNMRYGSPLEYQLTKQTGAGVIDSIIDGVGKVGKLITDSIENANKYKYGVYEGPTTAALPRLTSNMILGLRRQAAEEGLSNDEFRELLGQMEGTVEGVARQGKGVIELFNSMDKDPMMQDLLAQQQSWDSMKGRLKSRGKGLFLPGHRFGSGIYMRKRGTGFFDTLGNVFKNVVNFVKGPGSEIFSYAKDLIPTAMEAIGDAKDLITSEGSFADKIRRGVNLGKKYLPKAMDAVDFARRQIPAVTDGVRDIFSGKQPPRRQIAQIVKEERTRKALEKANRRVDQNTSAESYLRNKQLEAAYARANRNEGKQLTRLQDAADYQPRPSFSKYGLRERMPPTIPQEELEDDAVDDEYYGSGLVQKLLKKRRGKMINTLKKGKGFARI